MSTSTEDVDDASSRDPRALDVCVNSPGRWWLGVVVGVLVSVPIGWVLSLAGTLPFFLGPFFFALLGLIVGATVHRVASPRRPYSRNVLRVGTTVVVLACWGFSLVMEGRDFPIDAALDASRKTRVLGGRTADEFRADVVHDIRRHFREVYPPGGTVGYVRWVVASGELTTDQIADLPQTLRQRQQGIGWIVRASLCLGLLFFGIGSQTLPLRSPYDRPTRAPIEADSPSE